MILTYSINYIFIGKAFNVNRYVYVHMQVRMNTSPRFTLYLKDMYCFREALTCYMIMYCVFKHIRLTCPISISYEEKA